MTEVPESAPRTLRHMVAIPVAASRQYGAQPHNYPKESSGVAMRSCASEHHVLPAERWLLRHGDYRAAFCKVSSWFPERYYARAHGYWSCGADQFGHVCGASDWECCRQPDR